MIIIAFAGPSLPRSDRAEFPGVDWRPPCEAGDLLRLDVGAGDRICVIDGWFDHRPALRHKELWELLARGVAIFGASSIGALRAAEMAPFGMVGIGAIFRAYASGRLTGDDEVALIHGPEAWDWRPLSVPLVDVRATLCRALRTGVARRDKVDALLRAAGSIHYVDRTWAEILATAALPPPATGRLNPWLAANAVDQKRIDARACLRAALESGDRRRPPISPIRTVFLAALARACSVRLPPLPQAPDQPAMPAIDAVPPAAADCGTGSTG
jgi:hypothetical protein